MEEIILQLKKMESLRNGVPTFALFTGIEGSALFNIRTELQKEIKTENNEVDIILHSAGGLPAFAYRIIKTFREKYATVNVIVPLWAKSAATLLAFGGNRIILGELGELGPIDAQIKKDDEKNPEGGWASALNVQSSLAEIEERSKQGVIEMFNKLRHADEGQEEILKIGRVPLAQILFDYSAKFYQPLLQKIETVEIGVMARYLEIGKMYAKRILKQYTNTEDEKIKELLNFLVYDCPDHGYVVDQKVLLSYLPHIKKVEEPPFGPKYAEELENLATSLMAKMVIGDNVELNQFVKNFPIKATSSPVAPVTIAAISP